MKDLIIEEIEKREQELLSFQSEFSKLKTPQAMHDALNELQRTIIQMVKSKEFSKKEMTDSMENGIKAILIADWNAYGYLITLEQTLIDAINGKYDKEIAQLNI